LCIDAQPMRIFGLSLCVNRANNYRHRRFLTPRPTRRIVP